MSSASLPTLPLEPIRRYLVALKFDFSFQPSLDRNQILTRAELGFVERREVVDAELIASLTKAEREGPVTQRVRFLTRPALLIDADTDSLPCQLFPGSNPIKPPFGNQGVARQSLIVLRPHQRTLSLPPRSGTTEPPPDSHEFISR